MSKERTHRKGGILMGPIESGGGSGSQIESEIESEGRSGDLRG